MFTYLKIILLFTLSLFGMQSRSQIADSITTIISEEYDQVSKLHRTFLGDSYRKLYNTPVRMRVMQLSNEKGGLSIVKLGGGMQTQSLRLADTSGREYVLRSIQKFPERSLPEAFRMTIAKDIVQDQVSIVHPYGALTVPPFNKALGIKAAEPELVFVGDDPRLGEYRDIFKNRAYIFEVRMPDADNETDNTLKVIRKLKEDNDVFVEQEKVLHVRLLDMVLGDWDRHEDNWRWQPKKNKGETEYIPVPRDRDKVYYHTSGILPVLLSYQYLKANVQPYNKHIRNIDEWNFNARHFDRLFLNELSANDWREAIAHVQQSITDAVISEAMTKMPIAIQNLSSARLYQTIKARRDSLHNTAMIYYLSLAKTVDIPLSEKNEFIAVDVLGDQRVTVTIHNKKKDGTPGRRLFERTFIANETSEIRLYGLDGNDEYTISGESVTPIKIRLIGGKGFDKYLSPFPIDKSNNIYIYDSNIEDANDYKLKGEFHRKLSADSSVHSYEYDNFVYDRKGFLFNLNYGIDRGLILELGYLIEKQGFRKKPLASRHTFMGHYLTGRKSFMFDYLGELSHVINNQDLILKLNSMGPLNQSNFFGYGNETIYEKDNTFNDEDRGIDYYRSRYDLIDATVQLRAHINDNLKVSYGWYSQFYTSSYNSNDERFLQDFSNENNEDFVFGNSFFSGLRVDLLHDKRDQIAFPTRGYVFYADLVWQHEVGGRKQQYWSSKATFSLYHTLGERFTIANRSGVQKVFGSPNYYQHAQLGGESSLRGFNSRRFTGESALYNNLDLRYKLWTINSYIFPATIGMTGFYDVGRVWIKQEHSNMWHHGIGGGIFVSPGDLFVIQASLGFSREAVLPYIRVGMSF